METFAYALPSSLLQGGLGGPGQEKLEEEVAEARAKLDRAKGNRSVRPGNVEHLLHLLREQLALFYARKERELNVGPGGEQVSRG